MMTSIDTAAELVSASETLVQYCNALFNERNPKMTPERQMDMETIHGAGVRFQKKAGHITYRLTAAADSALLQKIRHDLKNELNVIIGFTRLMLREIRTPLTPLQYATVGTIHQTGVDLLELVEQLR